MWKSSSLALALCLASPALAQTNITDYGAQPGPGHDNTNAINACLDAAAAGYFHCHKPPGVWHIMGSLKMERETGQMGFGFDGPGVVVEDNSDLPILVAGGVGMQAPYIEANLQYLNAQSADMKNSACLRIDMPHNYSSFYNGWVTLQCTNAYHGIDQRLGSFWGMTVPWLDCKHNSGKCVALYTNREAGAPNNYWGHIYTNPVQDNGCPDGAEVQIEFASNTVIDNLEVNNSPCPIARVANTRGTMFRNVRFEHGWIRGPQFAGHAMIEADDDGATIQQIEIQTVEIDTNGDFAIFQDLGSSFTSADTISGAAILYGATLKSGHFYAVNAPRRIVHTVPFALWYTTPPQNFSGQVAPGSLNVNP